MINLYGNLSHSASCCPPAIALKFDKEHQSVLIVYDNGSTNTLSPDTLQQVTPDLTLAMFISNVIILIRTGARAATIESRYTCGIGLYSRVRKFSAYRMNLITSGVSTITTIAVNRK